MSDTVELIKGILDSTGELIEVLLNALSLLFIVLGVVSTFWRSLIKKRSLPQNYPMHLYFRMHFGAWLVVALELLLAADIVATNCFTNL